MLTTVQDVINALAALPPETPVGVYYSDGDCVRDLVGPLIGEEFAKAGFVFGMGDARAED